MNDKAIVPADQAGDTRLISMADLERMAEAITQSGLFGIKTVQQALSLMLIAQAEGLHPALAARDYDIIQGKPALKSKAKLARFQRAGGIVKWIVRTDTSALAEFFHPSSPVPITVEWNIDMATKAGLAGKDNWKKHPRQMLSARVISEGVDATYPDAGSLMYVPEELQDMSADRTTPSSTGLFDRPPEPPCNGQIPSTPVQATAEVVNTTPTAPKEATQPIQQTLPLSPPPVTPPVPAKPTAPKEPTSKEKLDAVLAAFVSSGCSAILVDRFFVQKKWLTPGQCLMDLSPENIARAHKTIDQLILLFKAWAKQQEMARIAAEAKAAEEVKK